MEIAFNGGRACECVRSLGAGACLHLLKIENGARGLRLATKRRKRGEAHLCVSLDQGDRAVGGAEVEADCIEGKFL